MIQNTVLMISENAHYRKQEIRKQITLFNEFNQFLIYISLLVDIVNQSIDFISTYCFLFHLNL